MQRRSFLKQVTGCAAALTAPRFTRRILGGAAAGSRPNVLFIAVDDLNDWVGCLGGHPDAKTPHIDRLAARGTLFERAYCSAPVCNPSRASLLTGRLPSTTGVYTNRHLWRKAAKLKDAVTLPAHFRANGYDVVGGGKIFHGGQNDDGAWDFYLKAGGSPRPPELPGSGVAGLDHFAAR